MAAQTKKQRSEAAKKAARTRAAKKAETSNGRRTAGSSTGIPGNQTRADAAQHMAETTAARAEEAAKARSRSGKKSDITITGPFRKGEEVGIYEEAQVLASGKLQGQPVAKAKASGTGEVKLSGVVLGSSLTAVGADSDQRVNFTAKK